MSAAGESVMVDLRDVSYRYRRGGGWALHGLVLRVERSRLVGVVGPNGSGKTTLFRLMLGFVGPSRGILTIDGMGPADYRVRNGIGYLPERLGLPENIRVGDFGLFVGRLAGLSATESRTVVEATAELLAISDQLERPIRCLSHGYRQRLGLLAALLGRPELLLLDEPANGLDPESVAILRGVLRRLKRRGRTVIVSSHNLHELGRLCDEVFILGSGRLLGRWSKEEIAGRGDVWVVQLDVAPGNLPRFDALCAQLNGTRMGLDEAAFVRESAAREFARRVGEGGWRVIGMELRPLGIEYFFHSLVQESSDDGDSHVSSNH